jgi:hypothetical protein
MTFLSSQLTTGPKNGDEPTVAGASIQWVLANDGDVAWPEGTTLRLVAGPALMCPVMGMPAAAPGQTVIVDFEVGSVDEPAEVVYSLVTPCAQIFGEMIVLNVAPKPAAPQPRPVVAVLATPMDGVENGIEALQGELKTVEWTLANVGQVAWPEDVVVQLIYNTPGFAHLPAKLELPAAGPGMTVQAGLSVLMPEAEGAWKAMWVVSSETHPDFGDILLAEFSVSDFPFMEWMMAEEPVAESVSDAASSSQPEPAAKLSATVASQQHLVPHGAEVSYEHAQDGDNLVSLGRVTGLQRGMPWVLELVIANDGEASWPANAEIKCCFGQDMGCSCAPLAAVPAGAAVVVQMELTAPEAPCQAAWAVVSGDEVFGPVMMLEVL